MIPIIHKIQCHGFIPAESTQWKGGVVLANLGIFYNMWVTKEEYEEFGSSILERKRV